MNQSSNRRRFLHSRAGFSMIESLAAAALLAVATGLVVKTAVWSVAERRDAARRLWAQQDAENVMQRLTALPYAELTADAARSFALSPAAERMLPDGELTVDVSDSPGVPPARRVHVGVQWRNAARGHESPVRLTAWVYQRREQP